MTKEMVVKALVDAKVHIICTHDESHNRFSVNTLGGLIMVHPGLLDEGDTEIFSLSQGDDSEMTFSSLEEVIGEIQKEVAKLPAIGTKVIFSVFPNFTDKSGVVVEGGIELTDKGALEELGDMVSTMAEWENVFSYTVVQ